MSLYVTSTHMFLSQPRPRRPCPHRAGLTSANVLQLSSQFTRPDQTFRPYSFNLTFLGTGARNPNHVRLSFLHPQSTSLINRHITDPSKEAPNNIGLGSSDIGGERGRRALHLPLQHVISRYPRISSPTTSAHKSLNRNPSRPLHFHPHQLPPPRAS